MPHFDIVRTARPAKTFRVASVMGTYDLQENQVTEHFEGDIDLPADWSVGLIVGNSGTGKTTIARELFPDAYITNYQYNHETILDDMPKGCSVEQITKTFTSCGFASVPSWLKKYDVLSNGEKMRVDIARAILEDNDLVVFDEFTSVVDRQVAKVGSFAMQKAIRKTSKKFIAVTCHFDVEDWLLPDWVFNTNDMTFHLLDEGQKKNRPDCRLEIYETKSKQYYWNIFKKHHYLNHSLNSAARVFVATLDGQLCGLVSIIKFPHPILKNAWQANRIVVLPDYQGLNISFHILEYVCSLLRQDNQILNIITSNPSMINILKKSSMWQCKRKSRLTPAHFGNKTNFNSAYCSNNRITCSFRHK